tara:strand:+ start:246 stop:524 length:279 start_codon:yes stop_codon:yes gene_type:complete
MNKVINMTWEDEIRKDVEILDKHMESLDKIETHLKNAEDAIRDIKDSPDEFSNLRTTKYDIKEYTSKMLESLNVANINLKRLESTLDSEMNG